MHKPIFRSTTNSQGERAKSRYSIKFYLFKINESKQTSARSSLWCWSLAPFSHLRKFAYITKLFIIHLTMRSSITTKKHNICFFFIWPDLTLSGRTYLNKSLNKNRIVHLFFFNFFMRVSIGPFFTVYYFYFFLCLCLDRLWAEFSFYQ